MSRPAYYNEIDPVAAQWLRNLIIAGEIAPGVVDERSIEDVKPDDLRGFGQCHFFAGIGGWPLALRRVGWPDSRRIWSGSCPCQPFSAAGAGGGFADERHLWPAFDWLIGQLEPAIVVGEQVANRDAEPWLDLVSADLEALGFAVGAVAFPSAGVGAPHIRDRTYWVARRMGDPDGAGLPPRERTPLVGAGRGQKGGTVEQSSRAFGGVADAEARGWGELGGALGAGDVRHAYGGGDAFGGMADAERERLDRGRAIGATSSAQVGGLDVAGCGDATPGPGPVNGFWRSADWLACRDGKWRAVEPGTFPLAHGVPGRVGGLHAYGNAINVEAAVAFLECALTP